MLIHKAITAPETCPPVHFYCSLPSYSCITVHQFDTRALYVYWAKWLLFCRRYFEMHFLDRNAFLLIHVVKSPIVNKSALIQPNVLCITRIKPLLEPKPRCFYGYNEWKHATTYMSQTDSSPGNDLFSLKFHFEINLMIAMQNARWCMSMNMKAWKK